VKVEFRESFAKDLKGVKDKSLLKRAKEVIEAVEKADSLAGISNLKKLKGGGNYFRVKVGDFRVGITLESGTVIFIRFLNRKDIYKYFP
jgi:mRNA interferase RelE/StbE